MQRDRLANIALIALGNSTQVFAFSGVALFLPLIREDLGLTFSQAGALAVAATILYAAMQLPSGYLADRFGARRLFIAGLLGTNTLAITLSVIESYGVLLINQAAFGFFRSLVFAPGLVLIAAQFGAERRATAMSFFVAGAFATNMVLGTLGPVLVEPLGWRLLFLCFGLLGYLAVFAYVIAGRSPAGSVRPPRVSISRQELGELMRHAVLWVAALIQFVRLAVVQAMNFWLPTYLVADKGFDLSTAGIVIAAGAAAAVPANFLGGYISDRLRRPLLIIGVSLSVLAIVSVLLVGFESLPVLIGLVVVQSMFIQFYFGPLFDVPIRLLGATHAGTINGFSNFWANVGGLTFAYTLGAVRDATGSFAIGFYSLAGMCVIGLLGTGVLRRLETRTVTPAPVPQG